MKCMICHCVLHFWVFYSILSHNFWSTNTRNFFFPFKRAVYHVTKDISWVNCSLILKPYAKSYLFWSLIFKKSHNMSSIYKIASLLSVHIKFVTYIYIYTTGRVHMIGFLNSPSLRWRSLILSWKANPYC